MRHLATLTLLAVLVAGCGGAADEGEAADSATEPAPSEPAPSEPAPSEPAAPPAVPAEDPPPCAQIRAGIDAFNLGDPEETVERFEAALPQAEEYAVAEPGRTADLLLAAVEYYVELPPEDYRSALQSSPEFRRHQVVTLAVCRYQGLPGGAESDEAVPA